MNIRKVFSFIAAVALTLIGTSCQRPGDVARFETASVQRGNISQYVTASGTLSALISVDVGSQVSGKIAELYADFNSPVKKGQLVAEIDPTLYDANLKQATGELASARATLTLKRQNLARKTMLVPIRAATQLDLDQATAEVAQADSTVTIREAALDSAKANLGYCKITAPVDGIIISRKVDRGQTVIAAMNAPLLFTVAQDITKMNISAAVSEADVGQVREGQPVSFTVDAFPEETFKGVVTQVRRAPTTTQNVVTYETIITVENPEQKLFPGMTANVSILVAQRKNAFKIPNSALRFSPPEGASFEKNPPKDFGRTQRLVYQLGRETSTLKPVVVKAGITDGIDTEIVEGLGEADAVVISTLYFPVKSGSFVPKGPPAQTP